MSLNKTFPSFLPKWPKTDLDPSIMFPITCVCGVCVGVSECVCGVSVWVCVVSVSVCVWCQ